jgi:NADH-quinone oxidoreductase subunit L
MFLGCGVGAYSAGVFHVITHAFFKALLFLGAGSVIHGMHEEQDIMKMGGLKKHMPVTHMTWLAGWLAICGVVPFAGFFSKDEILWQAFSSPHGNILLWALGAITAVMTAFYMTRLTALTFWGKARFEEHGGHKHDAGHGAKVVNHPAKKSGGNGTHGHGHGHDDHGHGHGNGNGHDHGHAGGVHESPWVMTLPLIVLAVLSTVGGFLGIPHMSWIEKWLEPVIPAHEGVGAVSATMEYVLMGVSLTGAIVGMAFANNMYRDLLKPAAWAKRWDWLHKTLENKWYVDEFYEKVIVKPIQTFSTALWKGFDVAVIDRIVLSFGRVSEWTGQTVRVIQTGSIQIYALMLAIGIVVSLGYLIYGLS